MVNPVLIKSVIFQRRQGRFDSYSGDQLPREWQCVFCIKVYRFSKADTCWIAVTDYRESFRGADGKGFPSACNSQ